MNCEKTSIVTVCFQSKKKKKCIKPAKYSLKSSLRLQNVIYKFGHFNGETILSKRI